MQYGTEEIALPEGGVGEALVQLGGVGGALWAMCRRM
jgi:hypothetical protein